MKYVYVLRLQQLLLVLWLPLLCFCLRFRAADAVAGDKEH
ncbi:hypothetical protein PC120_g6767 [Phytophthora cactorum]|nr:hypothetical protein PC120_g6767 [Phytophthora cactorum]